MTKPATSPTARPSSRSSSRPPPDALLTTVAAAADGIAVLVERRLGVVQTSESTYAIRVTRPHGPSTDAGALAMQHIVLQVARSREIIIGRICASTSEAWVHGHEIASRLYARRNRRSLPISFGEYAELAWKLDALLSMSGFARVPPPPIDTEERPVQVVGVFASLAAAVAAFFVSRSAGA